MLEWEGERKGGREGGVGMQGESEEKGRGGRVREGDRELRGGGEEGEKEGGSMDNAIVFINQWAQQVIAFFSGPWAFINILVLAVVLGSP